MLKKFFLHTLLVVILASLLCFGYIQAMELPSYAVTEEDWQSLSTNNELVESFRAYCKSRDLTIEGSLADAVTSCTSQAFFNITKTLGIDVTQLMAEVKQYTPAGLGTRFYLSSTGIGLYNQIFAQFLQDYELEEGQPADKTIKSGRYFQDASGNGCFIFEFPNVDYVIYDPFTPSVYGTPYLFNDSEILSMSLSQSSYEYSSSYHSIPYTLSFHTGSNVNYPYDYYYDSSVGEEPVTVNHQLVLYPRNSQSPRFLCYPCVVYGQNTGKLYFSCFSPSIHNTSLGSCYTNPIEANYSDLPVEDVQVVSPTITAPLPDDVPLQILPNGDTTDNVIPDDGSGDEGGGSGGEGGGSGGGSDTDVDITIPNFNFSLPDIDFQLDGLTNKFPFCIPGDMVSLVTLLNAEPVAPRIQGTVPLGSWTTWEIDFDFARFDDFAALMRGFELVGFIFFLVGATIRIVKG